MATKQKKRGITLGTPVGAKPSTMPGFIKPQLATLRSQAPTTGDYLHEIKFDGYRAQVHLLRGDVTIYTRNGLNWTKRFTPIVAAFDIRVERAVIDGEIVVIKDNRTNFSELQADLAAGRKSRLSFYAFDLLYLDGNDLRAVPQVERKRLLKALFDKTAIKSPVFYSEHFEMEGSVLFARACALGLEGIISKRADAPYRSDRNEGWLKIKCVLEAELPIVGYIAGTGGVKALYLGRREGKELVYAGTVGTGFTDKVSADLRRRLDKIPSPQVRLSKQLRKPDAKWVQPKLVAKIEYRDITSDGLLRHSSFKGLKD